MTCPDCGYDKPHFRCLGFGCGAHNMFDDRPCIVCGFFKFERVDAQASQPSLQTAEVDTSDSHKTKRRRKSAAN